VAGKGRKQIIGAGRVQSEGEGKEIPRAGKGSGGKIIEEGKGSSSSESEERSRYREADK